MRWRAQSQTQSQTFIRRHRLRRAVLTFLAPRGQVGVRGLQTLSSFDDESSPRWWQHNNDDDDDDDNGVARCTPNVALHAQRRLLRVAHPTRGKLFNSMSDDEMLIGVRRTVSFVVVVNVCVNAFTSY